MPILKPRNSESHKGNYGHVVCVGGSADKPGAILLTGRAALRTGAGLVTVALPAQAFRKISKGFLELMYAPFSSLKQFPKILEGKSVVAIGPGLGVNQKTRALVQYFLKKVTLPIVLDADGLNVLGRQPNFPREREIVLTPHVGEMSRLTGRSIPWIQKHREKIAKEFAVQKGVTLVLKGHRTVTATPSGKVHVNTTGNPGMATAGMGDVLTGVIASLIAQGVPFEKAIVLGVYLHGRAGDRVAKRLGDRGLLASDVIDEIPLVIKKLV